MARKNFTLGLIGVLACLSASSGINSQKYPPLLSSSGARRSARMIGGDSADAGQFPYQVSLQHRANANLCGGSIIGERFVVTAAHCVYDDERNEFERTPVRIVAGTTAFSSRVQRKVIVDVAEAFIPREYDPSVEPRLLSSGDIAVLKLARDIGLKSNENIAAIRLATKDDTYEDVEATVSGFGWTRVEVVHDPKTGKLVERGAGYGRLNYAKAKVVQLADCQTKFAVGKPGAKHVCAAVVQRNVRAAEGVCKGDSGGPLARGDTLIGVLSNSPRGCREDEKPAIYTKVAEYRDFIDKVVTGKIDSSVRSRKYR